MTNESLYAMLRFRDTYLNDTETILDVGSLDVNGSYAAIFKDYNYTGVDICGGENVDVVLENPYKFPFKTNSFDAVISGHTFEHIKYFWLTFEEMVRVLRKDGLLCIIAPMEFKEHRHPVDCWRFMPDSMIALANYCGLTIREISYGVLYGKSHNASEDVMLVAQKEYYGRATIMTNNKQFVTVQNLTETKIKRKLRRIMKIILGRL